uniref:30S ribosomal protein 3, chloroplastic n=1 Tax=Euglena anabaena TaxID=38273 RepID=Q0R3M9_EUGAN|nr:putative ribosomal protein 3 [Euglenaria anabaena]ABB02337.1 Ycf65 [Euglenaria anabaena]AKJ83322.1 putative ribosomal protein 3 [Euglenaria anabaena]
MERFILKFLWLEKSIGVALDQKVGEKTTPLNDFKFWPGEDSWNITLKYLENSVIITEAEKVRLLNTLTDVITYWQDRDLSKKTWTKKEIFHLQEKFPGCVFVGFN